MFTTFPKFSRLTLADREQYEEFIKDFPPIGDISFQTLFTAWDAIGSANVSMLNGNLVIAFWTPGDEEHSGLSVIGTQQMEQTICAIFDHLRDKGEVPRLANVPEFVVYSLRYPELFKFISQRGDDEYIMSLSRFASLGVLPSYQRARIKRFMREAGPRSVEVRSIDLSSSQNKDMLLEASHSWPKKGLNAIGLVEEEAHQRSIFYGEDIGIKNLCLFVDNVLQAYFLYHKSQNAKYIIADHVRLDYGFPSTFDYMVYAFSGHLQQHDKVQFVNLHADFGFDRLRLLKIALRPSNFFRKYTIEPADS